MHDDLAFIRNIMGSHEMLLLRVHDDLAVVALLLLGADDFLAVIRNVPSPHEVLSTDGG